MNIPKLDVFKTDLESAFTKEKEVILESEQMLRLKKENRPEYEKRKKEIEDKTLGDYVTDIIISVLKTAKGNDIRERKTIEANLEMQTFFAEIESRNRQ